MKTTTRILLLISLLVVGLAAPARGDSVSDLKRQRDAARTKRTQIQKRLDVLKASDADLSGALERLHNRVLKQENELQAAQQASLAAQAVVRAAEEKLAATDAKMNALRKALTDRAIQFYMRPSRDSIIDLMRTKDLAEASRREALLNHVISSDRDILDQLRVVREDQDAARGKVAKARETVRQRRQAAIDGLKGLQASQGEQSRLHDALNKRIAEFIVEADAVERNEASLSALIRAKEGAYTGPISASGLIWPIRGPITSGFGMRWGRMHSGIDIGGPIGMPIHAAKSGTVITSSWMGGYGNAVVISHGGGFSTLYGHQSRIAVHDGQTVSQGETIGYVGSTGNSTGPHLHFETRVNGTPQNPRNFLH
jgi:murein DD-endopeptidase MepM/ murein hydrolase activator NlpD